MDIEGFLENYISQALHMTDNTMTTTSDTATLPQISAQPATPPRTQLQPIDFDLSQYLIDIENFPDIEQTQQIIQQSTSQSHGHQQSSSRIVQQQYRRQLPMLFSGCSNFTINGLTINVYPNQEQQ